MGRVHNASITERTGPRRRDITQASPTPNTKEKNVANPATRKDSNRGTMISAAAFSAMPSPLWRLPPHVRAGRNAFIFQDVGVCGSRGKHVT